MNWNLFQRQSLKTRVALFTLAIFLISLWLFAFCASLMLKEDMERLSGEQQFSAVSFMAATVNDEMQTRLKALEGIASQLSPAMIQDTADLQRFLEQRFIIKTLFNGGAYVNRIDGKAIADVPISTGRMGMNTLNRGWMTEALKGKSTIGRPVMGEKLRMPVFTMAAPVFDARGKVIAVLAGVTNLGMPNFLDKIAANRYAKTGDFYLVSARYRQIITSSDKRRIMDLLPEPGVNPVIDRLIDEYEGSLIMVNRLGVEMLSSAKKVPVADWYVAVGLPTEQAFAPIHDLLTRLLLLTILLSLLAGGLTWWILRQQLSPMLAAIKTLAEMSDAGKPAQILPITRQDEIGDLICGFNRLIETLQQQQEELTESHELLSLFIRHSPIFTYIKEVTPTESRVLMASENTQGILDMPGSEIVGKTTGQLFAEKYAAKIAADDWAVVSAGKVLTVEEKLNGRNYATVKFPIVHRDRTLLAGYTIDITERNLTEAILKYEATHDTLTGVLNRRALMEALKRECSRGRRHHTGLAVVICDIDYFKNINDTHGHMVGDEVLSGLIRLLEVCLRKYDYLGRWGGEEFMLILPSIRKKDADQLYERLRKVVMDNPIFTSVGGLSITISIGVKIWKKNETVDELIAAADEALYRAKREGRNRVCFAR